MTKITRTVPALPELQPIVDRFKQIAAEAGDHQLLGDGPPHPDAELLDLCGEALHFRRISAEAEAEWHAFPGAYSEPRPSAQAIQRAQAAYDEWQEAKNRAVNLAKRASKFRATTAAGIYAKALLVRTAVSVAAVLATSLAEDLVSNPALRASLWAADGVGGSARRAS